MRSSLVRRESHESRKDMPTCNVCADPLSGLTEITILKLRADEVHRDGMQWFEESRSLPVCTRAMLMVLG
jgi:hypothetical protein